MRLDTKKIPGFDTLPDDARAYLSTLEVAENADYNKLASENKKLKDDLRAKQTDDERAAAERAEQAAQYEKLQAQFAEVQKVQNITAQQTKLMGLGYDDALARQAAEHLVNGDLDKFTAVQAKFLEARDAKLKEQKVNNTPYPPNGNGAGAADYAAKIATAQAEGDWAQVAQLTRLQQQTPPAGT